MDITQIKAAFFYGFHNHNMAPAWQRQSREGAERDS